MTNVNNVITSSDVDVFLRSANNAEMVANLELDANLFNLLPSTNEGGLWRHSSGVLVTGDYSPTVLDFSTVTTALGYTPVNKAGDTMDGSLIAAGIASTSGISVSAGNVFLTPSAISFQTEIGSFGVTRIWLSTGAVQFAYDIRPLAPGGADLGQTGARWRDLFLTGNVTAKGTAIRSGSADPTISDLDAGTSSVWKNTTSGEIRTWVNDGGVMKSSAAFT